MAKKKKIKIPKSVLDLRMSPKKFAKKNGIKVKGKGLSKSEKKRNVKRLKSEYSEAAIVGLNKAVKILSENSPEDKKVLKIRDGVDNIVTNPAVMKKIAKLYKDNPDNYPHLIFLPYMIMNTLEFYNREGITDEEKAVADSLDATGLMEFCEKILKKEIRRYRKAGLSENTAFRLATAIPTTKPLKGNREWYKNLIQTLYVIADEEDVDLGTVLPAIIKVDKKKGIDKKDFYDGFFSQMILSKSSNKHHNFNDHQKQLHEDLIEKSLEYLDSIKGRRCKEILKTYIKRRKTAESYKNDGKRIIKFIDHANSNSPHTSLRAVISDLISENSSNEIYLS